MDLPAIWRSSDAVVFARAVEVGGTQCKAKVLELFRRHFGGPKTEFTLPQQPDTPWKPGDEFIAFLRWNSPDGMYRPAIVLPVRDGRVVRISIDGLPPEMDLEAFLTRLRSMQE
jgi:hypothetical protein